MGRAKEWMMEQWERGYSAADGDICAACVSDAALKAWVEANVSATQCTFCGVEAEAPIAAGFDDFVGFVLDGIRFEWNHPDDEGIMYISAEGGYQARSPIYGRSCPTTTSAKTRMSPARC